jgi:O-antigen/teichoic acid export membrane protein
MKYANSAPVSIEFVDYAIAKKRGLLSFNIMRGDNMDKTLKMGQDSATGSFHLFAGKTLSTIILAAGTIILGWFILEGDYGLYTVALIPASTFLLFQDWGVGSAMTRICAQCRAAKKEGTLRRIIIVGLSFEVASGIMLTALSLFTSNFMAITIFGKPESAFLVTIVSITILSTSVSVAAQSIFVGFEQMKLSSLTMIVQAIVQSTFAPLLVYMGYGAFGAVLGYTLASMVAGVISLFLLYFSVFRKLEHGDADGSGILQVLKPMLTFGVPLAIAVTSAGLLIQFYSIVMASFVDNAMIGNYRVASNFGVLLTFFTFPIATVLFPVFSKIDPLKEKPLLKQVFGSSAKYTALLLLPATIAMMVLAKPIIGTVYGAKWLYAPSFLILFVMINLLAFFGNFSVQSFLVALGETRLFMKLNVLTLAIGVPLAFLLIPQFGIAGVIVGSLVAGVPAALLGLYFAWKRYGVVIDFRVSFRILLASVIAGGAAYLFLSVLSMAEWVRLTAGFVLFLGVFLTIAPIVGAVSSSDVSNLRAMFSSLGILSKLLNVPLAIMEKTLKICARNRKMKKSSYPF